MRRLILEEPYSEAAVWGQRLALFAIALAAIGAIIIRTGAIEVTAGLTVFGAAIMFACIALLMAGAGMTVIWRSGRKGIGHVASTIFLALALLALPAWLSFLAVRLPLLNDVTTDVNDPPAFSQNQAALAARAQRTPSPIDETRRFEQQRAYPEVQPIVIDVEVKEGYLLVSQAVRALGWRLVEEIEPVTKEDVAAQAPQRPAPQRPAPPAVVARRAGAAPAVPLPPQRPAPVSREPRDGRIDAIARSLIMGFPDDITIRIRALPDQTRIDVRSASRYGRHDFGVNARRIRRFAAELQAQLDADQ